MRAHEDGVGRDLRQGVQGALLVVPGDGRCRCRWLLLSLLLLPGLRVGRRLHGQRFARERFDGRRVAARHGVYVERVPDTVVRGPRLLAEALGRGLEGVDAVEDCQQDKEKERRLEAERTLDNTSSCSS